MIVLWVVIIAVIVLILKVLGKKKRLKKTFKTMNPEEQGDMKE